MDIYIQLPVKLLLSVSFYIWSGWSEKRITLYFRQGPDQSWVQCDNPQCLKWRKLPDGTDLEKLPDKWYCQDSPYPHMRSCDIPEEKEDEIEQPYVKTQKKRL